MATRSNIAVEANDGTITLVYAHWDGYPSHNGRLLLEHYESTEAARALVRRGDVSILAENLDATQFYDDRGESWDMIRPRVLNGREDLPTSGTQEFLYLWVEDEGRWLYSDHGGPLKPLTPDDVC